MRAFPTPLSIRYTAPAGESGGLSGPVVGGPAPYVLAAGWMVPLRQAYRRCGIELS